MGLPKIAVLTSRLPYPLDKGDKLRIYNQLRVLSRDFEVHLICLFDDSLEDRSYEILKECSHKIYVFELSKSRSKRNVISKLPFGLPLQVAYFYDSHIKKRIDHILWQLQPVFIHCHLVRMAEYCKAYENCPKSIDFMDSLVLNDLAGQYLSTGFKRIIRSSERNRIKSYETKIASYFDYHFVISDRDRRCFDPELQTQMDLLPNGVDLQLYRLSQSQSKQYDVAFCGNLGYVPNIRAVQYLTEKVLPLLDDTSVVIAGADGGENMTFDGSLNIDMLGRVDDMKSVYTSAKTLVAPIFHGAGQQNKILEALALGVPCITTSFVNESIGAMDGQDILLADDPSSFARHIKDLLLHPEKRTALSINGRKFIEERFNWEKNTAPLIETIKRYKISYE